LVTLKSAIFSAAARQESSNEKSYVGRGIGAPTFQVKRLNSFGAKFSNDNELDNFGFNILTSIMLDDMDLQGSCKGCYGISASYLTPPPPVVNPPWGQLPDDINLTAA
jgi:hypothetical protein